MRGKVWRDQVGNSHGALTGVGLRRPERETAAALLAQLPGNPNGTRLDVDT